MSEHSLWSFADKGYILCSVGPVEKQGQRWLAGVRIYFVLSGRMQLRLGTKSCLLKADDIVLINKGEFFAITDGDGYAAAFDLDISYLERRHPNLWFDLNPANTGEDHEVVVLKEFLARFIKFNLDLAQDKSYLNRSLYYAVIHHLLSFFRVEKPAHGASDAQLLDRVDQISRYINANYRETLTLDMLAKHFYLSPPYMSRLIRQYFGTTFTSYLTGIRVQSSIPELERGERTIEEIAGLCGFSDSRTYISHFRKKTGMTPGEYRRRFRLQEPADSAVSAGNMEIAHSRRLEILARYLENNEVSPSSTDVLPATLTEIPACDIRMEGTPFAHHYQILCSIGSASDLLAAENQTMLRILQKEIGFSYIHFHGLLDEDMLFYKRDGENADIHFGRIDAAFDFLLSVGLKPFVELSYMPRQLAVKGAPLTNTGRSCVSLPADMRKWTELIAALVCHVNDRYGKNEVGSWPFSLWNLPDSGEGIFGLGTLQEYFTFYEQTFRTVRRCNEKICFCGPSCLTETMEEGSYYREFLRLCREKDCMPGYMQFHFYPMRKKTQYPGGMRTAPHLAYRHSPDALRESLAEIAGRMSGWTETEEQKLPLLVTEWNATVSHRELLNDTVFQAAYIAKNALETNGMTDVLCYWTLSDSIREVGPGSQLYHGGLGLFTYNGIRKASYQALKLLAGLGDRKLCAGDGWCITRREDEVRILLYNYQHYSQLYADGELFDMSFLNRYTPFVNPTRRKFSLTLSGMGSGTFLIREQFINRQSGSSFDAWLEAGALPPDGREELAYLQSASLPHMHKRVISSQNDSLDLSATLEPHEVRLIEIKRKSERAG